VNFEVIRDILFPEFKGMLLPAMEIDNISDKKQRRAFMDILHLCGYVQGMGDFFLTKDRHFLDKKRDLERVGIKGVMAPEDCVAILSKRF
jgi:hypothetical protein